MKELNDQGHDVILIRYAPERGYVLSRNIEGKELSVCASSVRRFIPLLPRCIHSIWINELFSYPKLAANMNTILKVAQMSGAKIRFLLHDFYCVCPGLVLLDADRRFCGVCDPENSTCHCEHLAGVSAWRRKWGSFLTLCDEIIAFSQDSIRILRRAYPQLKDIQLIPHEVPPLRMVRPYSRTNTLTIGVIGAISIWKGWYIIEEMAALIRARQLPVHITVVGYGCAEPTDKEIISVTGKYQRDNLPDDLEQNRVDIVFIPSIWPETFSYTTSEAIYMGLPVACFNIGAPAERVANYDKGLIIPEITAESALDTIYHYWKFGQS